MQIKDHVFIVTGASSGIGLSTAIALSDRGARIALLARSTEALHALARRLPGSLPITADMTQIDPVREAIRDVHRHYGRVDGLINVVSEVYPIITATNFGTNRMGNPAGGGPAASYAEGDKPEFVADLILRAIEEGHAQYFANERLRALAAGAS